MPDANRKWLEDLLARNDAFRRRIDPRKLPVARMAGSRALMTCMDPRINPEGIGIAAFGAQGEGNSDVYIIRTGGGVAEDRTLIAILHLVGVREIAVVMHTDCAYCLAGSHVGAMADSLEKRMEPGALRALKAKAGEPWPAALAGHLETYDNPAEAVRARVAALRGNPLVPGDVVIHGLVYRLEDARLDVVIDGYAQA